jgi:hypothetical protein
MLDGKFEPNADVSADIQVRLECIRLATEFGVENDRKDPLPIAEKYYNWVNQNSQRQSKRIAKSKV